MSLKAMKLALEALENFTRDEGIEILRQAIDQTENQEPVAYLMDGELFTSAEYEVIAAPGDGSIPLYTAPVAKKQEPIGEIVEAFADMTCVSIPVMPPVGTKLYASPREWVSLTYDEVDELRTEIARLKNELRTKQIDNDIVDKIAVNLVREGINKHRARDLAVHFIDLILK